MTVSRFAPGMKLQGETGFEIESVRRQMPIASWAVPSGNRVRLPVASQAAFQNVKTDSRSQVRAALEAATSAQVETRRRLDFVASANRRQLGSRGHSP